jgi:hypothetical protein
MNLTPVVNAREVPAIQSQLHLVARTYYAAPILELTGESYRVEGDVTVSLKKDQEYFVNGVLSKNYSAVWLVDSQGRVVSDKIEDGDSQSLNLISKSEKEYARENSANLSQSGNLCPGGYEKDPKYDCLIVPLVEEAKNSEHIGGIGMTCSRPYKFSQDCSIWSGAKRHITINGEEIKVAGSAGGDVILVMGLDMMGGGSINIAYQHVKDVLIKNGFSITKVRPVTTLKILNGYTIEVSGGDAYELLKRY